MEKQTSKPTHAHLSITRLGGVNERVPVEYKGKSVYATDLYGKKYRLNAATFLAGEYQLRGSWAFRPWDDKAERAAKAEKNWQT